MFLSSQSQLLVIFAPWTDPCSYFGNNAEWYPVALFFFFYFSISYFLQSELQSWDFTHSSNSQTQFYVQLFEINQQSTAMELGSVARIALKIFKLLQGVQGELS